jgi:hypothetical protein
VGPPASPAVVPEGVAGQTGQLVCAHDRVASAAGDAPDAEPGGEDRHRDEEGSGDPT